MTQVTKKDLVKDDMPVLEIHRNDCGVKIFKCCMSCNNKSINSLGKRICKIHKRIVEKYDVCQNWNLSKGLENAGLNNGKVNIHCYAEFVQRESRKQHDETSKQQASQD